MNIDKYQTDRRSVISGVVAATAAAAAVAATNVAAASTAAADRSPYADPEKSDLPPSTMKLVKGRTALVVIDPQNDFLAETGVAWGVVGASVREHGVNDHLEDLFRTAKASNVPVFISPHQYFPHDHGWKHEGTLEKVMHSIKMFDRAGPLDMTGFEDSGADWLPRFKPYINDGKTVVCSPHKVYGNEQNDLTLQLRKRNIDQIILAGMSANLCVESHLRHLLEDGFEIAVVRDATAGAKVADGDGYLAALINFRMIADAVWYTDEAVRRMRMLA